MNTNKYHLGGYYIVKPAQRAEYMNSRIIPETILSVSSCLCDVYPDISSVWSTSENEKDKYRQNLNIPKNTFQNLIEWINNKSDSGDFGFPNVFNNLESAREFYLNFLCNVQGLNLVGIGLPEEYNNEFAEDAGITKETYYGVEKNIFNRCQMESNGTVLGFEVLGYEMGTFHSYICNRLEDDYDKEYGFMLNGSGFISTIDEARKLAEYTNQEIVGAEPVLWLPWVVVKYSF